jgi:hypothetical protein
MNTLRACTLVSVLLVANVAHLGLPLTSQARADTITGHGSRLLTGELVVTDAARNRFRLVGHGGLFTAPAGTPVDVLDGKPVAVELARDGRVLQISEEPIHIRPITRSYEFISGELVLNDAALRTFTIAGDDRVYVAPAGVDIGLYAGRRVEVRLDDQGHVMDIGPATRSAASLAPHCPYGGQGYSDGALLCQSGRQYRCEAGVWRSLAFACPPNDATASRWLRTCLLGDATVASGSQICRNGTTFRCADGAWVNVGTECS